MDITSSSVNMDITSSSVNMDESLEDDPEVELIKWLIGLQYPNVKVTKGSFVDKGHMELLKMVCDNIGNLGLSPIDLLYVANKYPLIVEWLRTFNNL